MQKAGHSSVLISWIEGFHGGYDQDIHVQTSSNKQEWTERNTISVSAKTPTILKNTTITDIASTSLYLRLFASNDWGVSKMSDIWNITLQGIFDGGHRFIKYLITVLQIKVLNGIKYIHSTRITTHKPVFLLT